VTFPEGLTIAEMAAVFESAGLGTKAMFTAAAQRGSLVHAADASADDLEGYLFPETYNLPRDAGAEMLVEQMAARFLAVYDARLREAARARGLTTRQVVTIASLIEKETSRADERPLVSAVYQNRMRIGMGMQCDPTVIYALQRAGRWNGNLTRENLQFDSPYNTYRYSGLPPGPIAAPGRASLEAAVAPADVTYLYFVSRNDGSHVFASTLDEHNRNVYQHQVQYFRDQRRAAGRK
jgi:peptidoglycan lytic transglycosylase G